MRRFVIALTLTVCIWLVTPLTTSAQSIGEYFYMNYDPVSLSENEIHGSNVFDATIKGQATCTKDFPVSVSEVVITTRVLGENTVSGARVTINTGYSITIKPFPSKKGETAQIDQGIQLQFPSQAESGDYNIIGQLVKAEVKVLSMPVDVTEYLPKEQFMGSIKYIAPEPAAKPASTTSPTPTPVPEAAPARHYIPWWAYLIVAIAIATTVVNIIWYVRRRSSYSRGQQ